MNSREVRNDMRRKVWDDLKKVAVPDSRFDYNFEEFIPDFEGSSKAIERVISDPLWLNSEVVFITPDNCLDELRYEAIRQGKNVVISTYGIRRGFVLLNWEFVDPCNYESASLLDGMEKHGRYVDISDIRELLGTVDLMITGGSVISSGNGVRFGKGHGFFDIEWGIMYSMGFVTVNTPVFAVVHDCQVIKESIYPSSVDSACDKIFTPSSVIEIKDPHKPTVGILWDKLEDSMLEAIPVLRELQNIQNDCGSILRKEEKG